MSLMSEENENGYFINNRLLSLSSFLLAMAVGLVSSFTFSAAYDMTRRAFFGEPASLSGVWHGQWQGVHAVTIRLEQRGETLRGTAKFSRIIATNDGPKAVGAAEALPLINPKLSGDTLSFEVQDSEVSYSSIPLRMEMRFTGAGEAELRREQVKEESTAITMFRDCSF